jgi:endonuclease-3
MESKQSLNYTPSMTGKEVVDLLDEIYPKIRTHLSHENPFQLLVATVLSAQSTDVQINKVTPTLFAQFPDAKSMSRAPIRELERLVKSSGFFHVKARRIKEISKQIIEDFHGEVPDSMETLLTLPGIGRKTANIVLSAGYGKIEGIAVDTHVFRLSRRIGLSQSATPEKIEIDLMKITPKNLWPRLSILLIFHGRQICFARSPLCSKCVLNSKCVYFKNLQDKAKNLGSS